jgi:phage terminase Nu1 subunit (DNA packaging protein)
MHLTGEQIALLLGLTKRQVTNLAKDGIAIRIEHGKYDGPQTVQNYIAAKTTRAKERDADLDEAKEAARLKKEQADNWELKNAKLRNELLPIDEVARVWSEQVSSIRSGLLAVVSRVRQKISLSAEDAVVLDEEIRDAMTKLADGVDIYDADAGDVEEGDVDPAAAAEDQPLRVDGKGNPAT